MIDVSELWNSPIIGTYLIWRVAQGYTRIDEKGLPILLVFLALAILDTPVFSRGCRLGLIVDMKGFLRAFHDSYGKNAMSLGALTEEIRTHRESYRKSIEFALAASLVRLDAENARLVFCSKETTKSTALFCKSFNVEVGDLAERLGVWLAKEEASSIAYMTGVNF